MRLDVFLNREPEEQVFVDPTGRRAVLVRRAMITGTVLVALWLAGLALGASGSGSLPRMLALPARVAVVRHRDRDAGHRAVPVAVRVVGRPRPAVAGAGRRADRT